MRKPLKVYFLPKLTLQSGSPSLQSSGLSWLSSPTPHKSRLCCDKRRWCSLWCPLNASAKPGCKFASTFALANEVNIFNARHYKADAELYSKFTAATGNKVNLINGKSGALEKRMIEEGADSSPDL